MFAVCQVQRFGGVLEHPEGSTLWKAAFLPRPGERDEIGGWTASVDQVDFGHKARKRTWLYIVGIDGLPAYNYGILEPTHEIGSGKKSGKGLKNLHKADRERTPIDFAEYLVDLARQVRM
jgi:hypothetical protein